MLKTSRLPCGGSSWSQPRPAELPKNQHTQTAELTGNSAHSDLQNSPGILHTEICRALLEFYKFRPAEPPQNQHTQTAELPQNSAHSDLQRSPKIVHTQTCRASPKSAHSDCRAPPKSAHPDLQNSPNSAHSDCRALLEFRVLRPADPLKNSANSDVQNFLQNSAHSDIQSSPGIQHIRPSEFPQNSAHSDLQSSPGIQNLFIKPSGDTLGLGCALVKSLILHRSLQAEELTSGI